MTIQEKELMDLIAVHDVSINREFNSLANMEFCEALAQAIIAKYPQILAEKVWEGKTYMLQQSSADGVNYFEYIYSTNGIPKKVEVFIREVE